MFNADSDWKVASNRGRYIFFTDTADSLATQKHSLRAPSQGLKGRDLAQDATFDKAYAELIDRDL